MPIVRVNLDSSCVGQSTDNRKITSYIKNPTSIAAGGIVAEIVVAGKFD